MPPRHSPARSHQDQDLHHMAKIGHGVPSQDPSAQAQYPLDEAERLRELQSSFSGGGLLSGIALGAPLGMLCAGPVGVMLGCLLGAIAGAWAGIALSQSLMLKAAPASVDQVLPLVD